jgi:hypothetical protein
MTTWTWSLLAAAVGSSDYCTRVAQAPYGTHAMGYTVNDQAFVCEEQRLLGKTTCRS